MPGCPFGSDKIITKHISEPDFNSFFIGYDIDDEGNNVYRLDDFLTVLQNVVPEFAFGNHIKINTENAVEKVIEAAKSIYKIKGFIDVKEMYDKDEEINDDDIDKKYLKRGEFGELLLHLLLRDYHDTIPLISKIYFKDAYGDTVHGFDAVHIQPSSYTLWLGESKIYSDSKKGIKALIEDIINHIKRDYLRDEFTIISKKLELFDDTVENEYWLNILDTKNSLSDVLKSIKIPLLCTYTSEIFTTYNNITESFISDYETEVRELKRYFDNNNNHPLKAHIDIILILFPIKSKNELIKKMHQKLYTLQRIG